MTLRMRTLKGKKMMLYLAGLAWVLCLVYLVYAIIDPERF